MTYLLETGSLHLQHCRFKRFLYNCKK